MKELRGTFRRRALVCCLADPSKSPRPNRVINMLNRMGFIVDVCSYEVKENLKFNKIICINAPPRFYRILLKVMMSLIKINDIDLHLGDWLRGIWKIKRTLNPSEYDIVVVENVEFLNFIVNHKSAHTKIICDLREFYPLEFEDSIYFMIFESGYKRKLCQRYLDKCDALITVSEGIRKAFCTWFGVESELIYSVPYYRDLKPGIVDNSKIKMVHHGAANPDRKLENMIHMFKFLDQRYHLDFYLVGNQRYVTHLKKLAAPFGERINFLEPLPFEKIIPSLNSYDIGLYLLEDTTFNIRYALPNKFFEYIQARLMLAIGPSPEMRRLTEQYNLGVVSSSFNPAELSKILNSLSYDDIYKYKLNSHLAAKELCFEKESKKLERILERLLGGSK